MADIESIKDLDDLDSIYDRLTREEECLKREVSQLMTRSSDVEDRLKKIHQKMPNPCILKSDGQELHDKLQYTCSLADKTFEKVKKMDLVSKRVQDCLTRVGDLVDLKTCTEGIQSALDNEEYENAALIVQRFLKIDEEEVKKQSALMMPYVTDGSTMTSMEEAFNKLHDARRKLQAMVMTKFDESVAADDVASVERFFKLFPFLNQEKEGLRKFSSYLSTKIHEDQAVLLSRSKSSEGQHQQVNPSTHPEQLGNLFQTIAKIIDVHQPLIETYYRHGNLLEVIEVLQEECDKRCQKILDDFKAKRNFKNIIKIVSRSMKTGIPQSSSNLSSGVTLKVDPRELDTLLTEMILVNSRSETYLKFLRKRATEDFEIAFSDSNSKDRKESLERLEKFVRSCQLSCLMQELNGHYVLMEEYFVKESVMKAIDLDGENEQPESSTGIDNNLLDDVFFILRKCIRRASSSGNMDVLCAVINHSITVLDTSYASALHERIRYGFPNSIASVAASMDLSQAYNVLQSGRYLQSSSDLEKTKKLFLTGVNNLDMSTECITTLRHSIKEEVSKSSVLSSDSSSSPTSSVTRKQQMGKLDSCLLDLTALTSKFQSLAQQGLHQMYQSLLKPRIKIWVDALTLENNELSQQDLLSLETTTEAGIRSFTSSLIYDLNAVLSKMLKPQLTANNYNNLIVILAGEVASRIESAILKCVFNRVSIFSRIL